VRLRRLAAPDDAEFRLPNRRETAVALGYVGACALYVVIGVLVTDFLLSVFVGIAYLLVIAWLVPAAVRRLL
jgi:hypothetical protein